MTRRVGGDGAGGVKLVGFVFGLCLCVVAAAAWFFQPEISPHELMVMESDVVIIVILAIRQQRAAYIYLYTRYVYKYVHRKK